MTLYINYLCFTLFCILTWMLSLQNPDAYKVAWKLLKVCVVAWWFLHCISGLNCFLCNLIPKFQGAHLTSFYLQGADGILVPGGFGERGVEGKILAAKYAREHRVPFLGICLGMQVAVIEFARSVLGFQDANSTEFDTNTKKPCVIFMPEVLFLFSSAWLQWKPIDYPFFFFSFTLWSDVVTFFTGLKNPHGRHHASWVEEDIFPSHGLQICKIVSNLKYPKIIFVFIQNTKAKHFFDKMFQSEYVAKILILASLWVYV